MPPPPTLQAHRAFWQGYHKTFEPLTYFARNRRIVDMSDVLVATPPTPTNPGNGGTWYTYEYARKKNKRTILIVPDGTIYDSMPSTKSA